MNNKSSSLITPGDQPLSSLWQKKPALPIEALHFEPTAEPVGTAEGELKMDVKQHVRAWCPSRVGPAGRTRQHTPASLLGKKKWGPLFGARSAGALAAQVPVLLDDQNRLTRNTVQNTCACLLMPPWRACTYAHTLPGPAHGRGSRGLRSKASACQAQEVPELVASAPSRR